jgi:hypothetical protein
VRGLYRAYLRVKPINLARRASFRRSPGHSSPARLEGAIDLTPATPGYRSPRLASRGCADLGAHRRRVPLRTAYCGSARQTRARAGSITSAA